jgi:hypothetical protein
MTTWRRALERDLKSSWVAPLVDHDVPHRCALIEDESPATSPIESRATSSSSAPRATAPSPAACSGRPATRSPTTPDDRSSSCQLHGASPPRPEPTRG